MWIAVVDTGGLSDTLKWTLSVLADTADTTTPDTSGIDLEDGLVAWYPFNGNANDESGNGNHGTLHGPALTTSRFGAENSAYHFDGIDDYIDVGQINLGTFFSLSAWVRFEEDRTIRADVETIFSPYPLNNSAYKAVHISVDLNDRLLVWPTGAQTVNPVSGSAWHFVCVTYQEGNCKLYVDDLNVVEVVTDSKPGYLVTLGAWQRESADVLDREPWNGKMDDVRVYNRALTEEEIDSLYREGGWTGDSPQTGTVTDVDGNIYATVTIGSQVWTVVNLRTTKYNDGTDIPYVPDGVAWSGLSTPGYCYYKNLDSAAQVKWGALYNWHAVNTGKLAPTGWRVPTDADWTDLENFLIANGYNYDGTTTGNKIAKSLAAKTDWATFDGPGAIGNDLSANNSTGFSALPGGFRRGDGGFYGQSDYGYWWSATETDASTAYDRYLRYDLENLERRYGNKENGFSVRLVRD